MAGLMPPGRPPDEDDGRGSAPTEPSADANAVEASADADAVADPRAVRVRLAPASQLGDEPVLRIAPPADPAGMRGPTAGRGLLGGAAISTPPPAGAPGVFAQGRALVDGQPRDVALEPRGRGRYALREGATSVPVVLERPDGPGGGTVTREVLVGGFRFDVQLEPERVAALRERAARGRASVGHGGPLQVKAVIPGKVVAVAVSEGDAVKAGQQLLVVEAMKMQNELRSPRDGTIERVEVAPGVNIEVGDLLLVIS